MAPTGGTTGFLFSLQANQLEGSFFLNVDVSSGSLLVLPLRVLTIFFQSLSPLVQIGLLPPAVQNIPLCWASMGSSWWWSRPSLRRHVKGQSTSVFESLPPPLTLQQGVGIIECQTLSISRVSRTYTMNVPSIPCSPWLMRVLRLSLLSVIIPCRQDSVSSRCHDDEDNLENGHCVILWPWITIITDQRQT